MRLLLMSAAAAILTTACNQADPAANQSASATSAAASAASSERVLEARVNMAPVAAGRAKAIMHERHEGMEKIGDEFKSLRRQLGGSQPDMASVARSAAEVDRLAQRASNWFPAGTGPDVGKTESKAEIWQKPQDFAAKMAAFQRSAAAFHAAAKSGNAGAAKAAFGDLGKTCKACHDLYREEDH